MGGILGALGGMLGGGSGNSSSSPIMVILQMLTSQPGGLGGLVNNMQQGGLGAVVSSWIGTGQNLPIDPSQLAGMFSQDQLSQLSAHFGGDTEAAHAALAEHLPNVIDQLSPEGSLPQGENWMQEAGDTLGGLLK